MPTNLDANLSHNLAMNQMNIGHIQHEPQNSHSNKHEVEQDEQGGNTTSNYVQNSESND